MDIAHVTTSLGVDPTKGLAAGLGLVMLGLLGLGILRWVRMGRQNKPSD